MSTIQVPKIFVGCGSVLDVEAMGKECVRLATEMNEKNKADEDFLSMQHANTEALIVSFLTSSKMKSSSVYMSKDEISEEMLKGKFNSLGKKYCYEMEFDALLGIQLDEYVRSGKYIKIKTMGENMYKHHS